MSNYLRIDGNVNIIDSFEKAENFLLNKKSLLDLKWFIISFHHAMHNLMLYALVDSAEGSIWKENKKGTLPVRRSDGLIDIFHKDNRLLDFMESFTYIQDKSKMNRYIDSKPFIAEQRHIDSMKHLNEKLRNKFVHYVPISWSIAEQYIYEICIPVLEVASFLVFKSGQCRRFEEDEKNKLKNIFDKINSVLAISGKKDQSENTKIILATRTDKNYYKECLKDIELRFVDNQSIEKIFIICDQNISDTGNNKIEIIFDLNPTRATAFNLVIDKLNKDKDKNNKFHLLTFSKEVELQDKDINEMIKAIKVNNNLIVVGYRLKDNILNDNEIKLYSNGDLKNGNVGIAYQVPWSTCALWNKRFVYRENDKEELRFDEICEKDKNQLGELRVKVDGKLLPTDYEGMEDGLAIAELVTKNNKLKYQLLKEELFWNISGNEEKTIKYKKKMARKNIVLSTFMNIKGYSIDKLREAGR